MQLITRDHYLETINTMKIGINTAVLYIQLQWVAAVG